MLQLTQCMRLGKYYAIIIFTDNRISPFSFESLYFSGVLLFSILGIFYHGYFYVYHLFHMIIGNELLLRAMRVS